jgi:iron donor protein CyaY
MDDQTFQNRAGLTLERLYQRLVAGSDKYGFEPDFNSGALTIEFEEPRAKFVVSPNAPVRQIWVSAHSKSYKLDWDGSRDTFVLAATGQTLDEFLEEAISTHLNEHVKLA